MSRVKRAACVACEGDLNPIGQIAGYIEGQQFNVLECNLCQTQIIDPRKVPSGLYDAIYRNAACIDGGYKRYLHYATEVAIATSPFQWLADQEDMYWGVAALLDLFPLESRASIIEVGCGLGYLTYSLVKDGYEAHGIDLSDVAVRKAQQRFGNYFSVDDAATSSRLKSADAVIATELLEHLPEPATFLKAVRENMASKACLIISTPNRSTYSASTVWNTDLPPVHLQWFSEKGIQVLARRTGFDVEFVDFTPRNIAQVVTPWVAGPGFRNPRFTESLSPLPAKTYRRSLGVRALNKMKALMAARGRGAVRPNCRSIAPRLIGVRSIAMVCRLTPAGSSQLVD
jgi:2-polyprenyl-3-methyl-5-hydroxy-6-metoxy-1,4-benzoquinol methylase